MVSRVLARYKRLSRAFSAIGLTTALIFAVSFAVFFLLRGDISFHLFQARDVVRALSWANGTPLWSGPETTTGGRLPGPAYYLYLALFIRLFGAWEGPAIGLVFAFAFATALSWRAAMKISGRACAALFLAGILSSGFLWDAFERDWNQSYLFPICALALALFRKIAESESSKGSVVSAGLFIGFAVQFHASAMIFGLVLLFAISRSGSGRAVKIPLFASAVVAPIIPYLVHLGQDTGRGFEGASFHFRDEIVRLLYRATDHWRVTSARQVCALVGIACFLALAFLWRTKRRPILVSNQLAIVCVLLAVFPASLFFIGHMFASRYIFIFEYFELYLASLFAAGIWKSKVEGDADSWTRLAVIFLFGTLAAVQPAGIVRFLPGGEWPIGRMQEDRIASFLWERLGWSPERMRGSLFVAGVPPEEAAFFPVYALRYAGKPSVRETPGDTVLIRCDGGRALAPSELVAKLLGKEHASRISVVELGVPPGVRRCSLHLLQWNLNPVRPFQNVGFSYEISDLEAQLPDEASWTPANEASLLVRPESFILKHEFREEGRASIPIFLRIMPKAAGARKLLYLEIFGSALEQPIGLGGSGNTVYLQGVEVELGRETGSTSVGIPSLGPCSVTIEKSGQCGALAPVGFEVENPCREVPKAISVKISSARILFSGVSRKLERKVRFGLTDEALLRRLFSCSKKEATL